MPVNRLTTIPRPIGDDERLLPTTETSEVDLNLNRLRNENATGNTLESFAIGDVLTEFEADAGLTGADPFPGVYSKWIVEINQRFRSNSDVVPRTISGLPGALVRWANRTNTVTVNWTVEKSGFPPEIPTVIDDNLVHLQTDLTLSEVTVASDGVTPVYRSSGISVYKAIDPDLVAVRPPVPPWLGVEMRQTSEPMPLILDLATSTNQDAATARLSSTAVPPVNP